MTIRLSELTHACLTRMAADRHETIDETVSAALHALQQDAMAVDLGRDLEPDEAERLDADAG